MTARHQVTYRATSSPSVSYRSVFPQSHVPGGRPERHTAEPITRPRPCTHSACYRSAQPQPGSFMDSQMSMAKSLSELFMTEIQSR